MHLMKNIRFNKQKRKGNKEMNPLWLWKKKYECFAYFIRMVKLIKWPLVSIICRDMSALDNSVSFYIEINELNWD